MAASLGEAAASTAGNQPRSVTKPKATLNYVWLSSPRENRLLPPYRLGEADGLSMSLRRGAREDKNMRSRDSALLALSLLFMAVPDIATAGNRFFVGPGLGGIVYAGGFGFAEVHPFDDGYDHPFGYGEYAEYGPWAYPRNGAGCYPATRKVWIGNRWRVRRVAVCN